MQDTVKEFLLTSQKVSIRSDLSGGKPVYVYIDSGKSAYHSAELTELLRRFAPLDVSEEALSFLLQNRVIPPPLTIYKNLYVVTTGIIGQLEFADGAVRFNYHFDFPFLREKRHLDNNLEDREIFEMIYSSTQEKLKKDQACYLFHSAGKDSNMIALAIAEAGHQQSVTLITHGAVRGEDESEVSKALADKMGYKHRVLREVVDIDKHFDEICRFFTEVPFPCLDNVCLAYPLYVTQMPELRCSTIIDGMGNDVYMGHVPKRWDFAGRMIQPASKMLRKYSQKSSSLGILHHLSRSRAEWISPIGFTYAESSLFMSGMSETAPYWYKLDGQFSSLDNYDFRSFIMGTCLSQEMMMRKVRNFSDAIGGNLIFPWSDDRLAVFFGQLKEEYLIDRKEGRNKVLLREILMRHLNLDSDKIGKKAFRYGSDILIDKNKLMVTEYIKNCQLWKRQGMEEMLNILLGRMCGGGRKGRVSNKLIYYLFLISLWWNNCKYVNRR